MNSSTRMILKPRIINGAHPIMPRQPLGQLAGTSLAMLHSCLQRLHSAHQQPGFLCAQHRSKTVLKLLQPSAQTIISSYCKPCQNVAVAAQKLCRTMQHNIYSVLNRTLMIRRHERIIQHGQQTMLLRPACYFSNVRNF
ncbi:hypothetical protein D3C78_864270 [compost metagenome]